MINRNKTYEYNGMGLCIDSIMNSLLNTMADILVIDNSDISKAELKRLRIALKIASENLRIIEEYIEL